MVSRHASRIHFCIFDEAGEIEQYRFALPQQVGDVHYGFISGITAGMRYALRAEGPWEPQHDHRFDAAKLLIDPYATRLDRSFKHHPDLTARGVDTASLVPKAIVESPSADCPLLVPVRPVFIYEIAVKAFTRLHHDVPLDKRGTLAALAEPAIIAHLQRLGVDTVELMPLTAWIDERHLPALGLTNAWGYNPVSFMAPDPRLAPGGFAEVRAAVEALHAAGIRVILDMVLNHSGESDEFGATLSLRGLDNALYYRHADGRPVNHTGCGNTLALDRSPVMRLAMDAMRTWVRRAGIDGFRFDLATVLGRNFEGFTNDSPLLSAIEQDPLLSQRIMIAEPWDVGPDGYRLGGFPARWLEWNDRYRDDVRRFWRGDASAASELATRIAGSSDIFAPRRRPHNSINYVAAHDGFTLSDTVTYAAKANYVNGEDNRDGNSHEPTWAGGRVKALLATLFMSRGTPMLTAGDEFGRSQQGNNNAYAQDNATTWLDWTQADQDLIDFTAALVRLRRAFPALYRDRFLRDGADAGGGLPDAQWLSVSGETMDWENAKAEVLGLVLAEGKERIALWFNRGHHAVTPVLPHRDGWRWIKIFCSENGDDLPAQAVALYSERRTPQTGISDHTLRHLATVAGVEQDWWEVDGTHHGVTPETLRTVLSALRIPHHSPEEAENSLDVLRRRPLPRVINQHTPVTLADPCERRRRLHIISDTGIHRDIDVAPGEKPAVNLPVGIYRIIDGDFARNLRTVIITPGECYLPDDIASGARVFGLASHLYALRHKGDGGIGDFDTLKRFAQFTEKIGGRYAGINPLHHMFPADRSRASPYQPSDRRFIDPIYISIAQLLERFHLPETAALAGVARAAFAGLETLRYVDYTAVWRAKSNLLEKAFAEFTGDPDFDDFVAAGGDELRRHGVFEARQAQEDVTPSRIAYRAFLQWIAEMQLGAVAQYRNLYRDLALGPAFDGGEVSEMPDDFVHGISLGAPPDPFSRTGQVWNLPPFSPLALESAAFAPLSGLLAANMRHAAALRIDHILGFMRQFWVPHGAEGRFGAYVNFPVDALIAVTALQSRRNHCMVVGEDLGTIPEGLREKLAAAHILSYRVLWFEREGAGFKPPSHYPEMALACLASHDLPTFAGWRQGLDIVIEQEIGRLGTNNIEIRLAARQAEITLLDMSTRSADGRLTDLAAATHGYVASAPSRVMLIQADDLAGETEPLNVPGTDKERPNWRRRLFTDVDGLASSPLARAIIDSVKVKRP